MSLIRSLMSLIRSLMSLIRSRRHKPYDAEGPALFEHGRHDLPYDARYDAERCVNFRRRGAKPGGAARSAKQTRPIRVRVVEHVTLRIIATRPPLSKGIRKWIHARTSGTALRPSTGRQREIVVPCCGRFVEVSWGRQREIIVLASSPVVEGSWKFRGRFVLASSPVGFASTASVI